MQMDHYRLVGEAEDNAEAFGKHISEVAPEDGGFLYSEAFFISLCSSQFEPLRMIEASATKGQAGELLAKMFPQMPVISVLSDENSSESQAAKNRIGGRYENHQFQYGEPGELIDRISKAGDFLILDGMAGFKGLKLLFKLLATRKFELAFMHDLTVGSPTRAFLEKQLPSTVYADDPDFAAATHAMDATALGLPAERSFEANQGKFGYGYGMACLPYDARFKYGSLARKAGLKGLFGG